MTPVRGDGSNVTKLEIGTRPAEVGTRSLALWATAGGTLACTHPFAAAATTAAAWQEQGTVGVIRVALSGARPIALPAPWMAYAVCAALSCAALIAAAAVVLDARRG